MILYIVHVAIDRDVEDDWVRWMRDTHLADVLDTGCFLEAQMARDEANDSDDRAAYVMIYRAPSAEAFTRYGERFAGELQADHTARYAGRFEAWREFLPLLACLPAGAHAGAD